MTKAETVTYSGQRIFSVKLYKISFFFFSVIKLNLELLHKWLKEKLNHLSLNFLGLVIFTSALLQHSTALPEHSSQASEGSHGVFMSSLLSGL